METALVLDNKWTTNKSFRGNKCICPNDYMEIKLLKWQEMYLHEPFVSFSAFHGFPSFQLIHELVGKTLILFQNSTGVIPVL